MVDVKLRRTPLYDFHVRKGAKMVPFAGYEMPVQYVGIIAEHNHTREKAGLFDVSHMGLIKISGEKAVDALEAITPIDLKNLPVGKQKYSYFTNDEGGILDDIMVSNYGDFIIVVVNAGSKDADIALLSEKVGSVAKLEVLSDYALLALQGPKAREVLSSLNPKADEMSFMSVQKLDILGVECFVSCSGYTGEDGYEIAVPEAKAEELAEALLANSDVMMVGLGARDTLRLEAGLCLYGNDIDTSKTPAQAGIEWAISKRRREEGGFLGADIILSEIKNGADIKLVGILPEGRSPVRAHASILAEGGTNPVGVITSGSFGPTLKAPIALGYVDAAFANEGSVLEIECHNKTVKAKVVKLPFVKHNYVKK